MMDDAEAVLKSLGTPEKARFIERFNTAARVKRNVNAQKRPTRCVVRMAGPGNR